MHRLAAGHESLTMNNQTESIPTKSTTAAESQYGSFLSPMENATSYQDYELPLVSVVIPTFNCAQLIFETLESVLAQNYPALEVVIIDAGSEDRTLEVIKGFQSEKVSLYCVSTFQRYEMLNKGISQSNGTYVNFLFPGDILIARDTVKNMMNLALEHQEPNIIYCGTVIRDSRKEDTSILFRSFSAKSLKHGLQPTGLQACWFRRELFSTIGKFNITYTLRGGFDFFCRVVNQKSIRTVAINRVYLDSEVRVITKEDVYIHFKENGRAIWNNFGIGAFFIWLVTQKDTKRLIQLWMKSLRRAFFGN